MPDWAGALARWRVTLGFASGIAVAWLVTPTCSSLAIGLPIAAAGEAVRIWAAGHLEKGREVTTSGPYRYVPHPLYLGSALMGSGLAVASRSIVAAVVIAIYFGLTLTAAIRRENAFLRERFADQFASSRGSSRGVSDRRFDLTRAKRNREHRAALGFVAAFAFLLWRSRCWR